MNASVGADERLVVMLEARISEFEKRMRQAENRGSRTFQGLQRGSRSATRAMEADMIRSTSMINRALATVGNRLGAFATAFGGMQVMRGYTRLADAATQMANSLRMAGLEGTELTRVYEKLFASAQRNSTPINALVGLYSKLALTQNELGVSSDDLIRFTDGIAVALKVAGTDATAASGALLQLSQALGGGIVRAEEFNSILEGTPTIAQAVARGLKEAGGSVAELRKLVVDGKVSSAAFFRAFEVGSAELRQQAEDAQSTVGQAFTRIGNSLVTAVGEFDQASGASESLARVIGDLADGIDRFDAAGFVGEVQEITSAVSEARDAVASWLQDLANAQVFADLAEAMGITEDGQLLNPDVREAEQKIDRLEGDVETLQARIKVNSELGFDNTEALARLREVRAELAAVRAEAANLPRHVAGMKPDGTVTYDMSDSGTFIDRYTPPPAPADAEPVSIADYPAGAAAGGGGGGRGRSGGGGRRSGGGGGRSARPDDYAREVERIKERTQALEIETAQVILAASGERELAEAMDFAKAKADLLTAAQKAGKEVTPELAAEIDALAQSYASAGMNAEDAADKMNQIEEQSGRGKDALSDMFGSIIDGSMSAKEAVGQLLLEIVKMQALNVIMNLPGMGQAGPFLGSLLTPAFADGGHHSGGLRIVGERGPELEATGPSRIWTAEQTRKMMVPAPSAGGQGTASQIGGKAELVIQAPPGFTSEQIGQIEGISVRVVQSAAPQIQKGAVQATIAANRKSKSVFR
ncbi:MAG: tape measure protein [Paracoccus sp. (in: a-proteobacteria)]